MRHALRRHLTSFTATKSKILFDLYIDSDISIRERIVDIIATEFIDNRTTRSECLILSVMQSLMVSESHSDRDAAAKLLGALVPTAKALNVLLGHLQVRTHLAHVLSPARRSKMSLVCDDGHGPKNSIKGNYRRYCR